MQILEKTSNTASRAIKFHRFPPRSSDAVVLAKPSGSNAQEIMAVSSSSFDDNTKQVKGSSSGSQQQASSSTPTTEATTTSSNPFDDSEKEEAVHEVRNGNRDGNTKSAMPPPSSSSSSNKPSKNPFDTNSSSDSDEDKRLYGNQGSKFVFHNDIGDVFTDELWQCIEEGKQYQGHQQQHTTESVQHLNDQERGSMVASQKSANKGNGACTRSNVLVVLMILILMALTISGTIISVGVFFGNKTTNDDDESYSRSELGAIDSPTQAPAKSPSGKISLVIKFPTKSPTVSPTTQSPSVSPSISEKPTPLFWPSVMPSSSMMPSGRPSSLPSSTPSMSSEPSSQPSSSSVPSIAREDGVEETFITNAPSASALPTSLTASVAPTETTMPTLFPSLSSPPTSSLVPTSEGSNNGTQDMLGNVTNPTDNVTGQEGPDSLSNSSSVAPTTSIMPSASPAPTILSATQLDIISARLSDDCPAWNDISAGNTSNATAQTIREVAISYEYTIIMNATTNETSIVNNTSNESTDETTNNDVVQQLENLLHASLLSNRCNSIGGDTFTGEEATGNNTSSNNTTLGDSDGGGLLLSNKTESDPTSIARRKRLRNHATIEEYEYTIRRNRLRALQQQQQQGSEVGELKSVYYYQGFNSNPPDIISNDESCPSDVLALLTEGQVCYLVRGGVTVVVVVEPGSVEDDNTTSANNNTNAGMSDYELVAAAEKSVKAETGMFVEDVFLNLATYESVSSVVEGNSNGTDAINGSTGGGNGVGRRVVIQSFNLLDSVTVPATTPPMASPTVSSCPDFSPTAFRSQPLDGQDLVLYYAIIQENTTASNDDQQQRSYSSILCIRMESILEGYIGFGISQNGTMSGAEAIIGIPSDGSVLKYNLQGGTRSVSVMEDTKQTLLHTSISSQDEYNNNGKMVMEFAKYFKEDNEDEHEILESGLNSFVYAVGPDGGDLGYHARRGASSLDLS